jgi:Tfp pilus assembly protein PilF
MLSGHGRSSALLLASLALTGCSSVLLKPLPLPPSIAQPLPPPLSHARLFDRKPQSLVEAHVSKGLKQLHRGHIEAAGQHFRKALAIQPKNVGANFLNAYAYHQLGQQGHAQHYESAAVGYELALTFDPQAWWAAYCYGQMELERRNFAKAQELFAHALAIEPEADLPAIGMAISSYYLGAADQAVLALQQAELDPDKEQSLLRPLAIINAANGDTLQGWDYLMRFREMSPDPLEVSWLQNRLEDWQRYHAKQPSVRPQAKDQSSPSDPQASPQHSADSEDSARQIVIEAIIIRSSHSRVGQRGINLLDGLSTLFSYDNTRTLATETDVDDSVTQSITRSIGISEVSYSLDIFNTTLDRSEIIARPSLLVMEGKESSFFSGDVFVASISGQFDGESLTERVGVSIDVTPTFLSDDEFILALNLGESDFSTETIAGTFVEALSITASESTINARVGIGQTLVLAGLSERKERDKRDKVPLLGDIPGIQELFRSKSTELVTTEIAILLTPKRLGGFNPYAFDRGQLIAKDMASPTPAAAYRSAERSRGSPAVRQGDLGSAAQAVLEPDQALWEEVLGYIYF